MRKSAALLIVASMALIACACTDKIAEESTETSMTSQTTVTEQSSVEIETMDAEMAEVTVQETVESIAETSEETETEQTTAATTAADPDDGCLGDDFILN